MKALPILLSLALITAGCDMDKITGVQTEPPTPVPTPRPTPTPVPKPKQGEWMFKNYKNPLDPPKR